MGVISLGLLTEEGLFLGSVVNNRFRKHLPGAKLDCGETPDGFRLGLWNTLNMLGCSQDDISRYLGWRSEGMARHYTRMSNTAGVSSQQLAMYCLNHYISLISSLRSVFLAPFCFKVPFGIIVIRRNLSNGEN